MKTFLELLDRFAGKKFAVVGATLGMIFFLADGWMGVPADGWSEAHVQIATATLYAAGVCAGLYAIGQGIADSKKE